MIKKFEKFNVDDLIEYFRELDIYYDLKIVYMMQDMQGKGFKRKLDLNFEPAILRLEELFSRVYKCIQMASLEYTLYQNYARFIVTRHHNINSLFLNLGNNFDLIPKIAFDFVRKSTIVDSLRVDLYDIEPSWDNMDKFFKLQKITLYFDI